MNWKAIADKAKQTFVPANGDQPKGPVYLSCVA